MSSLTVADISIKMRRRLGAPVSDRLRFAPLIDDALLLLSRESVKDKDRRMLYITDIDATTIALDVNGIGDLTTLIGSQRVLVPELCYGELYHSSNSNPLVERQQRTRPGNYDKMYLHYVLDGVKIRTQSSDNNVTPLTGSLSAAIPRWVTLAQLAEQEVERLVQKGMELLVENTRQYLEEGDNE